MTNPKTPAPPPESPCLFRVYQSSQKGGTLINVAVIDYESHKALLHSPDGYRPNECPHCGCSVMHVHDYRTRLCQLLGVPPVVTIVRYSCANDDCKGRWQMLPGFLARHLHFNWPVVEAVDKGEHRRRDGAMPSQKTIRRWHRRLSRAAAVLVRLLADGGRRVHKAVATPRELIAILGVSFAVFAAWVHALLPGVRLM